MSKKDNTTPMGDGQPRTPSVEPGKNATGGAAPKGQSRAPTTQGEEIIQLENTNPISPEQKEKIEKVLQGYMRVAAEKYGKVSFKDAASYFVESIVDKVGVDTAKSLLPLAQLQGAYIFNSPYIEGADDIATVSQIKSIDELIPEMEEEVETAPEPDQKPADDEKAPG